MKELSSNDYQPRHRRPLITGTFAVLFVLVAVAFAFTSGGYFATEKAEAGTYVVGTVVDYELDQSGEDPQIVVDVDIENPTERPIRLNSMSLDGLATGSIVARGSTSLDTTIEPDETETVTVRMRALHPHEELMVEHAEAGSIDHSGIAYAFIERYSFTVPVSEPDSGIDGGEEP